MSSDLPYDVVYCTSEDPTHPVSQLSGGGGGVRSGEVGFTGWQSARNGKTPQTLVIRFRGNVWVSQLRILSHEAKIASKVEVRVSKLAKAADLSNPPSFRTSKFVKLGSVDFNSNEQSNYKAKERKTVHLKTEAYFLKLLFDRPYVNVFNSGQQVGIYSLECSGHMLTPVPNPIDRIFSAVNVSQGPSAPSTPSKVQRSFSGLLEVDRRGENKSPFHAQRERPYANSPDGGSSVLPMLRPSVVEATAVPPSRGGTQMSVQFGFRSVRIIEFDDFFLQRSEELISLKEEAIAVEDYRVAAECRDKLTLLSSKSKQMYYLEQDKVQAIIDEDFEAAEKIKKKMNALAHQIYREASLPNPHSPDQDRKSYNGLLPSYKEESSRVSDRSEASSSARSLPGQNHRSSSQPDDSRSIDNIAIESSGMEQVPVDVHQLDSNERAAAQVILSAAGGEEGPPMMLSSTNTDATGLTATVGTFTAACLFSRHFKLREAALVVLTQQIDIFSAPPARIAEAVLRYLDLNSYGLQDTIPNVVFAGCTFVRLVLEDRWGCIGGVMTPLVALLPRFLNRGADNLQRVREEAMSTLTVYTKTPAIPLSSLLQACLMDPVDKDRRKLPFSNAKAQLARLNLLQLLLESSKFPSDIGGPMSHNLMDKLLIPTSNHPNPEVRDLAVSILVSLVSARRIALRETDMMQIRNAGIRETIASKQ